jgi:hypothetical protein
MEATQEDLTITVCVKQSDAARLAIVADEVVNIALQNGVHDSELRDAIIALTRALPVEVEDDEETTQASTDETDYKWLYCALASAVMGEGKDLLNPDEIIYKVQQERYEAQCRQKVAQEYSNHIDWLQSQYDETARILTGFSSLPPAISDLPHAARNIQSELARLQALLNAQEPSQQIPVLWPAEELKASHIMGEMQRHFKELHDMLDEAGYRNTYENAVATDTYNIRSRVRKLIAHDADASKSPSAPTEKQPSLSDWAQWRELAARAEKTEDSLSNYKVSYEAMKECAERAENKLKQTQGEYSQAIFLASDLQQRAEKAESERDVLATKLYNQTPEQVAKWQEDTARLDFVGRQSPEFHQSVSTGKWFCKLFPRSIQSRSYEGQSFRECLDAARKGYEDDRYA